MLHEPSITGSASMQYLAAVGRPAGSKLRALGTPGAFSRSSLLVQQGPITVLVVLPSLQPCTGGATFTTAMYWWCYLHYSHVLVVLPSLQPCAPLASEGLVQVRHQRHCCAMGTSHAAGH
jgi:hypothetical protein